MHFFYSDLNEEISFFKMKYVNIIIRTKIYYICYKLKVFMKISFNLFYSLNIQKSIFFFFQLREVILNYKRFRIILIFVSIS